MSEEKIHKTGEALQALWQVMDDTEHLIAGKQGIEIPREPVPVFEDYGETEEAGVSLSELDLDSLSSLVSSCTSCPLGSTINQSVFGSGSREASLMVVGAVPEEMDDKTGQPFVGEVGTYLDAWLSAISLTRGEVYITNVVKCRPVNNRDPQEQEIATCSPYLLRQIELIRPQMILCLGQFAAGALLSTSDSLGSLRGRGYTYHEIPMIVTHHPSAVLADKSLRGEVWEDLKKVASYLDLPLKRRES